MRRRLAVAVAVAVTIVAGMSPASGDEASSSSASAYGLSASGLLPISPTITAEASQPPDEDVTEPPTLLTIPLGGLALSGTIGVDAHAHRADDIQPVLLGVTPTQMGADPTTLTNVNAQSLAKTEGLAVLFNNPGVDPVRVLLAQLSSTLGGLIGADAVTAEAVAKCVNNQPVFETGFQVVGLGGLVGDILDPLVQPIIDLLLATLPPGGTLASIISIEAGRVTQLTDGVAIDGLVVRLPILNEEIVVSHAEAHMPGDCGIEAPPHIPTGPDPVAPIGQVAAQPRGTLASTGSDVPYLPLAAVMLGAAFVLHRVVRTRPSNVTVD